MPIFTKTEIVLVINFRNVLAEFLFCCYRLLHRVSKELAEWYFQDGRAVLAACCHLAVENIEVNIFSLFCREGKANSRLFFILLAVTYFLKHRVHLCHFKIYYLHLL